MEKNILIQYCEMKEEIKDIRRRKEKLEREIKRLGVVSDSVKGTRYNGTYGNIKITGYPTPVAIGKYNELLDKKELELLELMTQAEEYIGNIGKSEIRTMFRLYYIDGLPWWKVAHQMNKIFPERRIRFTEDSCRKRKLRFFENVSQCPNQIC